MIDYVSILNYNCKYKPFLGDCKPVGSYASGWHKYLLNGCKDMGIWWNPDNLLLKVEGSLPYYLKGHNFTFSTTEFEKAIDMIDKQLGGVGLWDSALREFENGLIVSVEEKPKEYIRMHYAKSKTNLKKKQNEQYAGKFLMWGNSVVDLKMYDAGANIKMKQGIRQREAIIAEGFNPDSNYLKFEVRYKKPELLNGGVDIPARRLLDSDFQDELRIDLWEKYKELECMKDIVMPTDKKNLSSLDILTIVMAQDAIKEGIPLAEKKKVIYKTINDAKCLKKADKDSRKGMIRKAFNKLELADVSKWDLSAKIEEALSEEG